MTCSQYRRATNAALLAERVAVVLLLAAIVLFFSVSPARATLNNGENAIDMLGEYNSSSMADNPAIYTKNCVNDGASPYGFDYPAGGVIDGTNHWLFVADSGNNRVLAFPLTTGNLISSKTPSYVLGQADFTTCAANQGNGTTASKSSLNLTLQCSGYCGYADDVGLAVDPTNHYLYVPDVDNHRIMVFSTSSMANGENASYEFGQPNGTAFTSNSPGTTKSTLNFPNGVALDGTHNFLFVADDNNSRIMVFPTSSGTPTNGNGENATYVIGQTNFTSGSYSTSTAATMYGPDDVAVDPTNQLLYVADPNGGPRVLIFNTNTTAMANGGSDAGENASYELGQNPASFTSTGANETQWGLNDDDAVTLDTTNHRLFVSDKSYGRVMIFPLTSAGIPTNGSGENASYVLGATDFVGGNSGDWNYNGFSDNSGNGYVFGKAAYDSTNNLLYVPDSNANRVMQFNLALTATTTTQGDQDACAITTGGSLYCWGLNGYGEDGLGNTTQYETPQQVTSPSTTWTTVSQSYYDACAITTAGALYCWGYNPWGEDGVGNTTEHTSPQHVTSPSTTWSTVSMGDGDACAITTAGKLYCWGENGDGEDGVGNTTQHTTPQQVGTATNWSSVSQNGSTACAINSSGALYCWGSGGGGSLGLGNTTAYNTPQQVTAISGTWTAVSGNAHDTCGINGGKLYCWGFNSSGEDGLGNTTEYNTPQQVGTATNWTTVSTNGADGTGHGLDTCAINSSGSLYCWGANSSGEDGVGNTTQHTTPQQVGTATNWSSVSQSGVDACAITTAGSLYCWGSNSNGEDGLGNTAQYEVPAQVTVGTINGENAADLLGQYTSATSTATVLWNGTDGANNGPNALGFNGGPGAVVLDSVNHALYVNDTSNCRVLVYNLNTDNSISASSGGHTADYVIGASTVQGNLNACADDGAPNYEQAALGIDIGGGMAVDTVNNRLFVADPADARVMVFSTPVTSNGENAIGVLGSTNYAYNNGGTTIKVFAGGSGASGPSDVAYDSAHHFLYVADTMNNRVMVFNVPTGFTNGENAIFELGQNPASFTTKTAAATQSGMNTPSALAYDPVNQRLFVADSGNSRVLMFNTVSLASGENATTVFGQTSFTGHGSNTTQTTMNTPDGLAYDSNNNRLFVTDGLNLRVLVFDVTPSNVANTNARNGPTSGSAYSAIFELGQAAGTTQFTTSNTGVTQSELGVDANAPNYPFVDGLYYDPGSGRLFVADILNNRVMIFESSAITSPVQHGFIPGYE